MKLIVGLGNPGRKYDLTRHNVGFIVADKIAALASAGASKSKFDGLLAEASVSGEKVAILCPQTYMNASGQSVRKAVDFYKLSLSDILVICDDLNLAGGRLRIKPSGSAGGQNGVKDLIRHLGSEAFPRLRIGIGRPPQGWTVTDYVLGKFTKDEQELFETATTRAAYAAMDFVSLGMDQVMSRYNADENAKTKDSAKRKESPKPKGKANPDSRRPSQHSTNVGHHDPNKTTDARPGEADPPQDASTRRPSEH